jgi:two-component system phosphate regulon sensor histidine kinase PhoR
MIARAEQRSRNLLHFVKDLLNLSRIRAAKEIEKKKLSLWKIIDQSIDKENIFIDEKKLDIIVKKSHACYIYANEESMEELFDNLLLNAIKYTPQNGRIIISAGKSYDPGFVQVSVEDTGIGIPPVDIPHIFEDFYRASNAEIIEKNGTGLGLSIVKQIVETHGGKIWAESQVGKGSAFTFILPTNNVKERKV